MTRKPHKPISPRRRRAFRLGAILIGLLGGLFIVEMMIRVMLAMTIHGSLADLSPQTPKKLWVEVTLSQLLRTDPDPKIVYRFKEGARGTFRKSTVSINALGLRDDEVEKIKPPKTIRILGLGDSTLWGWAVNSEETYIELLEDEMNWMLDGKGRVEAINSGVPGYMAVQEVETLKLLAPAIQPDAVFIQYDLNDAQVPTFMLDEDIVLQPNFLFSRQVYLLWLPTFMRGRDATEQVLKFLGRELKPGKRFSVLEGWPVLENSYRELAVWCRQRNIPNWVVLPANEVFPYWPDKMSDEKYDKIKKLCGQIGMPVIDTLPITQKWAVKRHIGAADMAVSPGDWHPTPERHALMTRAMIPRMAPALIEKELGKELAQKRAAWAGNMCLRQMTGKGFYRPERHDGRRMNWTGKKASMLVEPHGKTMLVPVYIGNEDVSEQRPLVVKFSLNGKQFERRYTRKGGVTETFEVAGMEGKQVEFAIDVDRTYKTAGDSRYLGILIYSLEFQD
ncbi:SGNH/GDSL hydrolase family protein [bacterium]|nr:SGNH/GDSL hydrolase family protein [bacterium]